METIEVKKIEYFKREQIKGLFHACPMMFYKITTGHDSIIGMGQGSTDMTLVDLEYFGKEVEENSNYTSITYQRDLTFDEFISQTHAHNPNNIYRKHIFIDCTDQS
jgi:hypothetical protein